MNHLTENNVTYFQHLRFAWGVAFVLLVHGLFPFIWVNRGSDLLCKNPARMGDETLLLNGDE